MRYRTLAFLTATPAFASILYVTSTLDFTTKPMFLEIRITGRFWSGNLFATWIFVVVISSWQNSTLSVRSSDMSSSKRGIVYNKDEKGKELDEMVVLDVGRSTEYAFEIGSKEEGNQKLKSRSRWGEYQMRSTCIDTAETENQNLGPDIKRMALFHLGQSGRWRGVGKNIWGSDLSRRLDTDGQELCDERFNRSFWPTCYERFEWNRRSGKKLPFCQHLTNFLIGPKSKQQWRMFLFTEMIFHTLPGIEMSPHDSKTEGVKKPVDV